MATQTTNLGLTLPIGTEQVSRQVINDNMTAIDNAVGAVPSGQNLQLQVTNNANAISDLKSAIGTVPTGKTVEGQIEELQTGKADVIDVTIDTPASVMTFSDGADGMPMAVKIGIEPDQELYGMPYPYPAGVTNNLIPDGTDTSNGYVDGYYLKNDGTTVSDDHFYISEFFPVTAGETYTFSNNSGNANVVSVCFYDENKEFISGVNANQQLSRTFEAPTGSVYARSTQVKKESYISDPNYRYILQFELGSTATTPMWYSNICPISGNTENKITIAHENVTKQITGRVDDSDGSIITSSSNYRASDFVNVYGAKKLYNKFTNTSGSYRAYECAEYDKNKKFLRIVYDANIAKTTTTRDITLTGDAYYVRASRGTGSIIELYGYNEYTIAFPQDAGTVYGGTLEVYKDGSGKLISTMANIANYDGETLPGAWISDRDAYAEGTTPTTGAQVVYELAEADYDEYTLSSAEVNALLTSLKGVNNLWADTGDILSVEYSADTKLYVDGQIAEKVSASQRLMELIVTANREDTMKATKAYSSGDLLIANGTLYKASTSIANGATLTEETNVTATTVAAEIAALA